MSSQTIPATVLQSRRIVAGALALLALSGAALFYFLVFHRSSTQAAPPIQSLAVLPLGNLSGDSAQEYFADGMTEALTTELARIGAL